MSGNRENPRDALGIVGGLPLLHEVGAWGLAGKGSGDKKRPRGNTRSKLTIDEERTVKVAALPRGSRFKGYTSFVVQDLVIRAHVVNFRRERRQTPDGGVMTAPLPAGSDGHFGRQLRRFVLAQYHQAQTTVPRLVTLLGNIGLFISKRQVVRLLIEGQDGQGCNQRRFVTILARAPNPLVRWDIYIVRAEAHPLGTVEAATAEEAVETGAKEFGQDAKRLWR